MTTPAPICDYEGSDYQTAFWEKGDRQYEDLAEAYALKALLPPRGRLLLEIGAGAGRNTPRYTGFERIVLLDYSRSQLEQARERLGDAPRYIYVVGDVYNLPFVAGLFDAATMIRVIHHLADAPAALAQVRRVLQPEAAFILEFASKLHLKAIGRWLLGRQKWNPFTPEPVEFAPLNFDFHPQSILGWLNAAGLPPRRLRTVSHFRAAFIKRLIPAPILAALDAAVQPTGQWWQLTPSVFVHSQAAGKSAVAPPGKFFRCPACGSDDLPQNDNRLECTSCGRQWAIRNGIYDFKNYE